jgi:uncharacterized SAM-binding protein YcdF (DUF218 family)
MNKHVRLTLLPLLEIIAALWLAGFALYMAHISHLTTPDLNAGLEPTDAVVVLTGGSERLAAGLDLLRAGTANKLFVSGVAPGLTLDKRLDEAAMPKELRACCIALGHAAESTTGNADETLAWMKAENYHSLRLVTANYHMPRSLMLFRALMPEIKIVPYPIAPESVKLDNWWMHPNTIELLVTEFHKYALARLWLWTEKL